jgi:hypothetical protein
MTVASALVGLLCLGLGIVMLRWGLRSWRLQESIADRLRIVPISESMKVAFERSRLVAGVFQHRARSDARRGRLLSASGMMATLSKLKPDSPHTTAMTAGVILSVLLLFIIVGGWTLIAVNILNRPRFLIPPHLRPQRSRR